MSAAYVPPPIEDEYLLPIKAFAKRIEGEVKRLVQIEPKSKRQWLNVFVPICEWLPKYDWKKYLLNDLLAGLAVGAMAVPQSFSYANLAGLPGVFGLYGMVTPVIIYSLFGSSRQLGVGPVAVTSLLLGNGLNSIYGSNTNPNNPKNVELQQTLNESAIQVCLLAGIMYTLIGMLGLSWIGNFLSHSVVSGFMSGAAMLIGLTQVKYILGIKIPRADTVPDNIVLIHNAINTFRWQEFTMGMCWIITLLVFRAIGTRYPRLVLMKSMGPVFISIVGLIIMNSTSWKISVVGKIPDGLPLATFSWWGIHEHFADKFVLAVLICCIDLCESLSIAKALAQKNRQEISQTQEIVALGLANLSGACFNSYTTTGSFSRSAVNQSVGAKSQIAGLTTGVFMLFVLLVLTPYLSLLPSTIQGAVVIVSVVPLLDFREWWFLWHANLLDFTVWNVAFFFVMIWGVEIGIGVSVGLSLALIVFQVSFPHMVALGRVGDSQVYRSVDLYSNAIPEEGILVVRIDAPIIFANFAHVRQFIRNHIIANKDLIEEAVAAAQPSVPTRIYAVVLDLSAVPYIDTSAIHLLHDLFNELKAGGRRGGRVQLMFANPNAAVIRQLSLGKFFLKHGTQDFFFDTHAAVEWAKANPEDIEVEAAPSLAFRSLDLTSEAKTLEEGKVLVDDHA